MKPIFKLVKLNPNSPYRFQVAAFSRTTNCFDFHVYLAFPSTNSGWTRPVVTNCDLSDRGNCAVAT